MIRRKIGNLLYPVFVYYLIELVVYYVFSYVTGEGSDTSLKLQLVANAFTIPYLLYLYKKNPLYMWVLNFFVVGIGHVADNVFLFVVSLDGAGRE